MKKIAPLIASILFCLAAVAQNKITIDLAKPAVQSMTVDTTKLLVISITNCQTAGLQNPKLEIHYRGIDLKAVPLSCGQDASTKLTGIFVNKDDEITYTLRAEEPITGKGKTVASFIVTPDGRLQLSNANGTSSTSPADPKNTKPRAEFDTAFVDPAFLAATTLTATSKECKYPEVIYDPCCNRFYIYDETGTQVDHLRYRSKLTKNKGVVFLISDFNTLKYDITVGNTFSSNFTDVPGFFDQVFKLIGPAASGVIASSSDSVLGIDKELAKIVRLNKDLKLYVNKKMMSSDCSGLNAFTLERSAILIKINQVFHSLQFDKKYQDLKQQIIVQNQRTNPAYTIDDYNAGMKKDFGLAATPDAIVAETQGLLDLLTTTTFEYQYNVPQLQNADSITFTLNIAPKTGTNGSIHVTNQPLSIPIRGDFKLDFSTGIYYSSVRNEKYSLQDITRGDTVVINRKIVSDGGDKNGKSAIGINALAHISYRLGAVQPSFVIGLGSSLDLNYSLLLGAGLSVGRSNRIVLSAGLNYSSVKVLSAKYRDASGNLLLQVKDVASLDTYNKVRTGWFFGLSYSFGSRKSQAASSTGAATDSDSGKSTSDSKGDSEKVGDSSKNSGDTSGKGKKGDAK